MARVGKEKVSNSVFAPLPLQKGEGEGNNTPQAARTGRAARAAPQRARPSWEPGAHRGGLSASSASICKAREAGGGSKTAKPGGRAQVRPGPAGGA